MNKKEFLENTIKYYSENTEGRRNATLGRCYYGPTKSTTDGCAIGRFLFPELQEKFDKMSESPVDLQKVFNRLPIWMKKLGKKFLKDMQLLHDNADFWNENGLSPSGELKVEEIRRNHAC